jgi:transposase
MKQFTKLNFKGHSIYVGMDVHLRSWKISVLTDEIELETKTMEPSAKILSHYLRRMFPGATYYSVYEAGYCGYWIHEQLINEGIRNIIVNPADVPTKDKEKRRKTDPVDSRKLARELRKGDLESIYIPDKQQQEDKLLLRTRYALVKKQTSCKNQIKSTLVFFGIPLTDEKIKSHWSKRYIEWLRKLCEENSSKSLRLRAFLDQLENSRKIIAELTKQIRALSQQERYKKTMLLLESVCGISTLSGMTILTEFGDIKRYSRLDSLCSYVGLPADEHTSGGKEVKLGITKRGNKYLKKVLIESSWVAIRKDPALLLAYKNYNKKNKGSKCIIKIARKLLNRIRYVLVTGKPYQIQTL